MQHNKIKPHPACLSRVGRVKFSYLSAKLNSSNPSKASAIPNLRRPLIGGARNDRGGLVLLTHRAESRGGGVTAQREHREEGEDVGHPVEEVRPLEVPTPDLEAKLAASIKKYRVTIRASCRPNSFYGGHFFLL